jgi:hypothetical protein
MKDTGQIIIAIIAIIIAVVQVAVKAKNKAKERNAAGHNNQPPSGGGVRGGIKEIFESTDSPFSWLTDPVTEEVRRPKVAMESTIPANEGFRGIEGERSTVDMQTSNRPQITGTISTSVSSTVAPPPTVSTTMRAGATAGKEKRGGDSDFDLREAVIYSEILKAKYQDY